MKRFALLGVLLAVPLLMIGVGVASADATITWTAGVDQGSNNLPCSDGAHWVLSPAQGITSATLTFKGQTYTMQENGSGSYSVNTPGPVVAGDTVTVAYTGDNEDAFLKLSDCTTGESPSPTPSESESESPSPTGSQSESPSETESPSPTESESVSPTESESESPTQTPSVKAESHTRAPTGGGGNNNNNTGGTAFTGSDSMSYTIAAALLMGLGLTSLYVARRRAARSES